MNAHTEIPAPETSAPMPSLDTYNARDLVKNGVQACIVLGEQTYFLRITRAGKLILTK